MIEVTFYKNGYEINGHAIPDICYQVSILAWAFANLIGDEEKYEFYTADYDNSEAGYTHCVYLPSGGKGDWFLYRFKQMLTAWADYYQWMKDEHLKIIEKDYDLVILPNFKFLKGIETTESAQAVGG